MEDTIFFKDIKENEAFIFAYDVYIKVSKDKALTLSGLRIFNPMEIVTKPFRGG